MARPRLNDAYTPFFDWLVDRERMNPSSAKVYTSCTRRIGKSLLGSDVVPSPGLVEKYFQERWDERDPSYSSLRRSWELFTFWREEVFGERLPRPDHLVISRGRIVQSAPLPDVVRLALRQMLADRQSPTLRDITMLRWSDVDPAWKTQTVVLMRHPRERFSWLIPNEIIQVLFDFTQPTEPAIPLLARSPGDTIPYPYQTLCREMRFYTMKDIEQERQQEEVLRKSRDAALLPEPMVKVVEKSRMSSALPVIEENEEDVLTGRPTALGLPAGSTEAPPWWEQLTGKKLNKEQT